MRTRIGILLFGGVATIGSLFWLLRPTHTTANVTEPPLVVPAERLDVGAIWETPSHTIELPVQNRSASAVEVTGWARSCSCLSVKPETFALAPGETRTIRVTVILTARGTDVEEEFGVHLTAISGDHAASPRWTITGKVRSPLPTAPREIDFGLISDLATQVAPYVFDLSPAVPLECLSTAIDPAIATVTVKPIEGSASQYRIKVESRLPLPVCERRATLRLLPVRVGGEALPARECRVMFRVGTDVQPNPPRLLLGSITEGDSTTAEVAFRSLTGRAFEIEPLSPSDSGVSVAGRDNTFGVTVRGVAGSQIVPVEFRIRQTNRPDYTVRVEAVYHGVTR